MTGRELLAALEAIEPEHLDFDVILTVGTIGRTLRAVYVVPDEMATVVTGQPAILLVPHPR